jgi:hypothetical protein
MTKASKTDWERIQIEFRAGTKSVREIATKHGISHTAINKRAREEQWPRDLAAAIKAKADAKVSKATVSSEVSTQTKITEALTIEVEAEVHSRIRLAHRRDVGKSRALAMGLLAELEAQTADVDLMQRLGEIMAKPDDKGTADKLNEAYQKAISLGARVGTMKALSETLKNLINLERQAFGMDDPSSAPEDLEGRTMTDAETAVHLAKIFGAARK